MPQHYSLSLSAFLFTLQYLGHVEVEESRGMHICEDAVKRLKTVGFTRNALHTSRNQAAKYQTSYFFFFIFLFIFSSISLPRSATTNILLTPSNISFILWQPSLICHQAVWLFLLFYHCLFLPSLLCTSRPECG